MAKQAETNLTEAETIRQARDGGAAAFEYPIRCIAGAYTACAYSWSRIRLKRKI